MVVVRVGADDRGQVAQGRAERRETLRQRGEDRVAAPARVDQRDPVTPGQRVQVDRLEAVARQRADDPVHVRGDRVDARIGPTHPTYAIVCGPSGRTQTDAFEPSAATVAAMSRVWARWTER